MIQNITQIVKDKLFFNDSKDRMTMALPCSKKTISIIKRNNLKTKNCQNFINTKDPIKDHLLFMQILSV